MINSVSRAAFSDELEKIASIKTYLVDAIKSGWHGPANMPQSWMGEGLKIKPGMGRIAKGMEYATSLGGLTKYLPIGGKSMALLGMAGPASMALAKNDPTGRGHSRAERVVGTIGNALGGLAGAGLAFRTPGLSKSPFLAGLAGGIGGGIIGERVITAPWALKRKLLRKISPPVQSVQSGEDGAWRNQAPGVGVGASAHSPNAIEGQAQLL